MAGPAPSLQVVYVIGVGRSGSTLLDIALGDHPRVESIGELKGLIRKSWPHNLFCSCGERVRGCDFWRSVHADWRRRTGCPDFSAMAAAMEDLLLLRRYRGWRSKLEPGGEAEELRAQLLALYESIGAVSGKDVVVDSSKSPGLGLLVGSLPGVAVSYVHLVRDVRGVARSFGKSFAMDVRGGVEKEMGGRSVWRAAAVWNLTNRLAERVGRQVEEATFTRIRYEDLVGDCVGTLGRLGPALGLDLREVARKLAAGASVPVGHNVGGNRLRIQGEVRLGPVDDAWRSDLGTVRRLMLRLFCGKMLSRYGYA